MVCGMAGRADRIERALEHGVALACVADAVSDPRERRRLARVLRELRREIGVSVPKRRAAATLGVTVPALERWIERGRLPVVRRPGVTREEVDADAAFDLAVEVTRLREQGARYGVLAAAFERLAERGAARPKLRPNESSRELREFYEQTTPLERLGIGAELSAVGTTLAARGVAAVRAEGRS
jgi:hypothetical protein